MDNVARVEVLRFEPLRDTQVLEIQAFTNALEITLFDCTKATYLSVDIPPDDVPKLIEFLQEKYGDDL